MRLLALPLLIALFAQPVCAQQEFAVGGVSLSLPNTWKGVAETNESHAPLRASYTFTNQNVNSELNGARVIVYRVMGLNGRERNQWWRGRLSFGYAGSRPVAAVVQDQMVFDNARAYRTDGNGQLGNIYLTQHGQAYFAIHISAPANVFESYLPALLDVARSIRFL